jgi:hypothetical protein
MHKSDDVRCAFATIVVSAREFPRNCASSLLDRPVRWSCAFQ